MYVKSKLNDTEIGGVGVGSGPLMVYPITSFSILIFQKTNILFVVPLHEGPYFTSFKPFSEQ